jgi:hypothetical protein
MSFFTEIILANHPRTETAVLMTTSRYIKYAPDGMEGGGRKKAINN